MKKLSSVALGIPPSPTIAIDDAVRSLKAQGVDVLSLGAGQPDFQTPEDVQQAGIRAITGGDTKYTSVAGTTEFREAVAEKLGRENGLHVGPEQVMAAAGVKHALYHALLALVEPGSEVVIPSPCWPSYRDMVRLAGGTPVDAPLDDASGFALDAGRIAAAVTPKTRVVLVNSPCNPTGAVATRAELEAIGRLAVERDLWIITDEIYEKLLYDGAEAVSLASLGPEFAERTITLNGFSKAFAMTGWRIGFAAGPRHVVDVMTALQSQTSGNCSSIAQKAAAFALRGADPGPLRHMQGAFAARRELVLRAIAGWSGARIHAPRGAFYAFVDLSEYAARLPGPFDPNALARHLLAEARVAVVPGEAFGDARYARLSFATSEDILNEALGRIGSALEALL